MKAMLHDFVEDDEGNRKEIISEHTVAIANNLLTLDSRPGVEEADDRRQHLYRLQRVGDQGVVHYIYQGHTNRAGMPLPSPRRVVREGDVSY